MLKKHTFFRVQDEIISFEFQQSGLSEQIFVKAQLSNFTDIRPVGTYILYADRPTDITKANSRLSELCERA